MNLTAVCKELDDQAVRMLDLMKQYIDLKMTLEDLVKTGSLHLAKSRYIMGNKSVSTLQLPTEDSELSAFVKVVEKDANEEESLRLELSRMSLSSPDKEEPSNSQDSQEDGLKRRKGKGKGADENATNAETEQAEDKQPEKKNAKKKEVMQDPLKWFGVLVPQNMRLAQSSFNKAIEISIEVANVQLEMDQVKQKYLDLLVKKKELTSQTPEIEEKP